MCLESCKDCQLLLLLLLTLLLNYLYAIKYLCAKASSLAGSTVAILPSSLTSYVSGSIVISGVLSFHIISDLPTVLQFCTGKTTFSRPSFSGTPNFIAAFDVNVKHVFFTAFPIAPNI